MDIRLDGRSAVITGGSKGLGLATAIRFAEAGADVAVLARSPESLEEARAKIAAAGGRVEAIACDVTNRGDIEAAIARAANAFGKVDILVNNVGQSRLGAFESLTDEDWRADFDEKLMSAIRASRIVWPGMKARRWGRILNVLSIAAKAPRGGGAPTCVTRAAGLSLTKVLAGEGAPHGILVNALLVGNIKSDQHVRRQKANPARALDDIYAEAAAGTPLGRIGEPEEFAAVACFLASPAASFVNGVAIPVDGGKAPYI